MVHIHSIGQAYPEKAPFSINREQDISVILSCISLTV